jgi:hypothetical protein
MRRPPAAILLCALTFGAGCGTDDAPKAEGRSAASSLVRSWPKRWCDLRTDMTRREVYRAMGAPTAVFPVRDQPRSYHLATQAVWSTVDRLGGDYSLRAFFYDTGTVAQLQAGRAPVRCARTRSGRRSQPSADG